MSTDRHDMNLAVLQKRDPGGLLWQPRIEFWYRVNRKRGTLPAHLQDASLLDVYDYCHAAPRYFTRPLVQTYSRVRVREERLDDARVGVAWKTPLGELHEVLRYDEWGLSRHRTEYVVKSCDDLRVLQYILADEQWSFDQETYEQDLARNNRRSAPQFYFRRPPLQDLMVLRMGFERTIIALHEEPQTIASYVEAATAADDAMYRVLCDAPTPIYCFGDNIDGSMDSPPIWREHLAPYYGHRLNQFHAAGKRAYIHVDGAMKPLLGCLQDCPFDGIEAATPRPQGDVTLEQIAEALGDMVLLDGIPAVLFLAHYQADALGPKSKATDASGQPFHLVGRRSIGRTESSTFGNFPVSDLILVPGPDMLPCDVLYTNGRTTIPGNPRLHVMFPTVWHQSDDSTSVSMAASHDGRVWNFLPGGYVLDTGPFGAWDGGCVFARPNLVELADGTFAMPVTGYNVPHKYPRGRYKYATGYMVWPKGRIVALESPSVGQFSTVAIMPPGRKLLINADTRRAGSIAIEVANLSGNSLPGRSFEDFDRMMGDLYRTPASWKGQTDLALGTPVILRFRMDAARLYALDFE